MRRILLVDTHDGGLRREIAAFDQVADSVRIGRQTRWDGHDERVPARSEAQMEGSGVQQHDVTWLRPADEAWIGQRADHLALDLHANLEGTVPVAPDRCDLADAPTNHRARRYPSTEFG